MTKKQNQNETLKEYQVRYHFWTDKRISQFAFLNNMLLTISLAIMGYFWKERNSVYTNLVVDFRLNVDWTIIFFFIGMTLLLYSTITGLFLAISRLYDLRLTSNIVLVRKWASKKNVQIEDESFTDNSMYKSFKSLCSVLTKYHEIAISRDEVDADNISLQKKFTQERQLSRDAGVCSWILMKNQVVSLLLSVILLMVVLLMK